MNKNKVIYQLTVEDVQNVAEEVYGRKLSDEELKKVIDPIAERIGWFEAIDDAIQNVLSLEASDKQEQ